MRRGGGGKGRGEEGEGGERGRRGGRGNVTRVLGRQWAGHPIPRREPTVGGGCSTAKLYLYHPKNALWSREES